MKKRNVDAMNARIDNIEKAINRELDNHRSGLRKALRHDLLMAIAGMRYCMEIIGNENLGSKSDEDIAKDMLNGMVTFALIKAVLDIDDGKDDDDE